MAVGRGWGGRGGVWPPFLADRALSCRRGPCFGDPLLASPSSVLLPWPGVWMLPARLGLSQKLPLLEGAASGWLCG